MIPSIAFVFGVMLFTLVCKTQQHREIRRVAALKTNNINAAQKRYISVGSQLKSSNDLQNLSGTQKRLKEAQSYENVTAVIYSNESKVTYCVQQDEDYVNPDATGNVNTEQDDTYLQPNHNLTETDGESYENMEGCVYSQPRKHTTKVSTEDDDYISPDDKHNLEQTDTESYENMAGGTNPDPAAQTDTDPPGDESYENMAGRTYPDPAAQTGMDPPGEGWYEQMDRGRMERQGRGESERQERREQQHWRQKTFS
ncbi:uncharacterized protein LOC134309254 isoform X2 [Trichomycterus rosablanca]|uniref:uncharacterized protein LOC134309254 isoform X2 n=1 Tax=Trichomycterus rosablanca TaxID=2290929 RepID=UPI002F357410